MTSVTLGTLPARFPVPGFGNMSKRPRLLREFAVLQFDSGNTAAATVVTCRCWAVQR